MKKMKVLLPLALLMTAFSTKSQSEKKEPPPPPPPPKVELVKYKPPVLVLKGEKAGDFMNRNPSVEKITKQGNVFTLELKNGTKESYDFKNENDKKIFTEKYGELEIAPPPPNHPPPPPPTKKVKQIQ